MPAQASYSGLSPLQQPEAAPDIRSLDLFGGVVDRMVLRPSQLLTLRVGALNHQTEISLGRCLGDSVLRPDGWHQNWFSATDNQARTSVSATLDQGGISALGAHTSRCPGTQGTHDVQHDGTRTHPGSGRLLASGAAHRARQPDQTHRCRDDIGAGFGLRDVRDVSSRLQLDLDLRLD